MIGAERRGRVYRARLRRHGDTSSRGRICARSVVARRSLEQETKRPRVLEARRIRKKKKHCGEDLREQADRSATSTLAVVQAPCNTMTPVAPGSSEANAVVAAINGALAPRLDGIQEQMVMLARHDESEVGCGPTECTGTT